MMFKSITLTNFRKHTNLHVDFSQGLIAVRGANESGKSTLTEAICYALFGVKGLRQSLVDVVTYGMPESALKVSLMLSDTTVITRSKSGAEITNTGVLCTGQKECTRWVEKRLGCDADVASQLMLASQAKLQGALAGSEAVSLIETLADFDLIDRVVGLIQNKLLTGNTTTAEDVLASREAQLAELPTAPIDTAGAELDVKDLNEQMGLQYEDQKRLSSELQKLDVVAARRFMVVLAEAKRDLHGLDRQVLELGDVIERPIPDPATPLEQIEVWRRELMGLKDLAARREAFSKLQALALTEPDVTWDGSAQSFRDELAAVALDMESKAADRAIAQRQMDAAAARKITETACAFCGKDLTDVPEVTRRNVEADAAYMLAKKHYDEFSAAYLDKQAEWRALHSVDQKSHEYESAVNRYAAFVIKIDDRYPFRWQWSGEPPATGVAVPDYNAMITAAERDHRAWNQALGQRQGALQQLSALKTRYDALTVSITQGELSAPEFNDRIRAGEQLERQISDLGCSIESTKLELQDARFRLERLQMQEAARVSAYDTVKGQVEHSLKQLRDLRWNNALLKRVRAARPAIADKLWTIVLASVGNQFSQIRGVQSVITRSDNGFKCDGQEVAGLSGSTLDALGLAIRIALTKTFLPNSRFMMLDEPGAAADNEREGNMLGLIAASDFDQVLLVTHSSIVDSFASQVVSL